MGHFGLINLSEPGTNPTVILANAFREDSTVGQSVRAGPCSAYRSIIINSVGLHLSSICRSCTGRSVFRECEKAVSLSSEVCLGI